MTPTWGLVIQGLKLGESRVGEDFWILCIHTTTKPRFTKLMLYLALHRSGFVVSFGGERKGGKGPRARSGKIPIFELGDEGV